MSDAVAGGLTSIIVPCCNQAEFTRHCLRALFRFTRPAWELVVVDNGSTDETATYLEGIRDAAAVPVTLIRNAENLGFPRAINQGLEAARGDHLVLLNNDAVVTDGWLDQLLALCQAPLEPGGRGRTIGMVGPMSNYAPPPQQIADVPYRDLDAMHRFAGRWRDEHRGRWFTVPKLSGFCVLVKRSVFEAVGGLDERFGLGFFDDDDLAVRARRAGFELAVAQDLFVHHFGSRTFNGLGVDAERLLEENGRRFAGKWGASAGRRVSLAPWVGGRVRADDGDGRLPIPDFRQPEGAETARHARVSLTMIVRDEEENLPNCLASVRGVFDEIVVVDTGSVDRTREVAREHGAKVFELPWVDDFAAARNAALVHATGDYAVWLDADDLIEPDQRETLVALLDGLVPPGGDEAMSAFVVRCACDPGRDGSGGETVVDHVRLFPLRPEVRWTYRVHEQILPALRRAGVPVRWTDLVVRHTGYADVALRGRKLERDARILREELKERPDDRSCCSTWGPSRSSGRIGERRWSTCGAACDGRRPPTRSRGSCSR